MKLSQVPDVRRLTFPYHEHSPPSASQLTLHSLVATDVCCELIVPERAIPSRGSRPSASLVAMPEAPVYENRPFTGAVGEVR